PAGRGAGRNGIDEATLELRAIALPPADEAVYRPRPHPPVLQVDEGHVDELPAQGEREGVALVFEVEFLEAGPLAAQRLLVDVEEADLIAARRPGCGIRGLEVRARDAEKVCPAHGEAKTLEGGRLVAQAAAQGEGVVVGLAGGVVRGREEGPEVAVDVPGEEGLADGGGR